MFTKKVIMNPKNNKKKIKSSSSKKKTAKRVTKKPVEPQIVSLPPEPTQPKSKGFFDYVRYLFIKPPENTES
jgi:hypothetical protein